MTIPEWAQIAWFRARFPLAPHRGRRLIPGDTGPDGRVDWRAVPPGYSYSGIAIVDSSRKPPESQHSGARAQVTPVNHLPLARFVGEVFLNSDSRDAADAGAVTLPEKISSPETFFP